MVNASKGGILLQFRIWPNVALLFDGLLFLNVKGDTQICSPDMLFTFVLISQDLNKIKKNPEHSFVDIVK